MKTMKEIGEKKVVETIIGMFEQMPGNPIPFGDDISAVELGNGKLAYLKCDMLVNRTDVPPGMNLIQVGRKAVVSVVSDFASKGVQPIALLSSLGIPDDFKEKNVKKIIQGLNLGAREYGAYVIGGDTNESSDLIIDCIGFGLGNKNTYVSRNGAKSGNLLAVTGFFGETAAGLKVVKEEFRATSFIKKRLLNAIYEPKARLNEGLALANTKALTSSMDSSDGLATSLFELSERSGVGFLLERIPISKYATKFAKINDLDPISLALYGGEEYELVFTFDPKNLSKVQKALNENLIIIGKVISEMSIEFKTDHKKKKILPLGWEHFKKAP